jgi:hypothetical protein
MEFWHHSMLQALGRLRSEQLLREAEEWRAARLASQSSQRQHNGFPRMLAWWGALLPHQRAPRVPLAERKRS